MNRLLKQMPIMNPLWWFLGIVLAVAVAFLIGLIVISARYAVADYDDSSLRDSKMNRVFSFLWDDTNSRYFSDDKPFEIAMPQAVQLDESGSSKKLSPQSKASSSPSKPVSDAELNRMIADARVSIVEEVPAIIEKPAQENISVNPLALAVPQDTQLTQETKQRESQAPQVAQSQSLSFDSMNPMPLQESKMPELNFKSEPIVPPEKSHQLNNANAREPFYLGLSQRSFPFSDLKPPKTDHRITRSALTYNIVDLEPANRFGKQVRIQQNQPTRLFWFNEITNSDGEMFYQSWYYQGLLMSRVAIDVKSDQWRASSYKTLLPNQQGRWRVATETLDEEVLTEHVFDVTL
ncbi:MAG TPA: hypothetical protein DHW71_12745 [Gammaproteobacteria bacterium]|nr:hypothetical protein [Gammaproteobacteria bacterium]MEC8012209.1 DUF2914 domain-containing protein [Pseudomonadota bacterium]HBF09141.1 hypothetical protein [Gammaproteobacteria bacterium]HCK93858.1 hypothetical protein [Gammaproteobacteria bacterium]|tara:strand:- start:51145 stop:52191 length:1047 start_codon:yes stop_codon:yes gene_type:complete